MTIRIHQTCTIAIPTKWDKTKPGEFISRFCFEIIFQPQPRFLPGGGSTLQHPQIGVPLRQERGNGFFRHPGGQAVDQDFGVFL